jgi:hypothetical protein
MSAQVHDARLQVDVALASDAAGAVPVAMGIRDGGLWAGNLVNPPIDPSGSCNAKCAIGENWTCVGNLTWPASGQPGMLLTRVLDAITETPVAGAYTSLCSFTDPTCSQPLARAQTPTGPSGDVALQIGALGADDAYVQFTFADPGTGDVAANPGGIFPLLSFWGYPLTQALGPIAHPWVLSLTNSEARQANELLGGADGGAALFAAALDTATIWFEVLDCNGNPAAGVQVGIDVSGTREFYFNGMLNPSFALTETDGTGNGGFDTVPPGVATLTAKPKGLNRPSSHGQVIARVGTLSVAFMYPTP